MISRILKQKIKTESYEPRGKFDSSFKEPISNDNSNMPLASSPTGVRECIRY